MSNINGSLCFTLFIVVLLSLLLQPSQSACYTTCFTCDLDNSINNCTSCNPSHFRSQSVSPNPCICNVGYVDSSNTSNPICIANNCSYKCSGKCQGSANICTSCNSGTNRYLSGTSCICNVGYYDNNVQICVQCSTKCKSCSTNSISCTDCLSDQYRYLNGSTCQCLTGYYDSGTDICSKCSYKCSTCSNNASCLTCPTGSNRSGTSCACIAKYYDDGYSSNCLSCHYSCSICANGISCSNCSSAKNRAMNPLTNLCVCKNRFYDNNTQLCSSCHLTCLTCTGSTSSSCLSCNTSVFRILNQSTGKCDCNVKYYQTNSSTQVCSSCHISCYTCSGGLQNNCLSCNSLQFRYLNGTYCQCVAGYYNHNASNTCVSCHYSCLTCISSLNCLTCPSNTQTINTVSGICECSNLTFWSSTSNSCEICNSQCLTCSISVSNCTSCDINTNKRVLIGNSCLCITKYYHTGAAICTSCHYSCLTCDSTGCLTCNSTSKRSKNGTSCPCFQQFYDDGSNQLCLPCSPTCLSCSLNSSNCLSCDGSNSYRVLSGTSCNCLSNYFDPGSGSAICQKCSNKCSTCSVNFTNCLTCAGLNRGASPNCLCNSKYYDTGILSDCLACHYTCKNCLNASSCLDCNIVKFRSLNLVTGFCDCSLRYYDDFSNQLCLSCNPTCLTCSGPAVTNCKSCNQSAQRYFQSTSFTCKCKSKYYQVSSTVENCAACHPTCLTCSGSTLTNCLTCSIFQRRIFDTNTNKCICQNKLYLDASFICQLCHFSCATCNSPSLCLTCPSATQIINSATGNCQCSSTKYWDSQTSSCVNCDYKCNTCFNQSTNCTSCDSTNFRLQKLFSCPCMDKYFDNSQSLCVSCHYSCLTCLNSNVNSCSSCNPNHKRVISNSSTCLCIDKFYDDGSNQQCVSCHYSCLKCASGSSCTECDPYLYRQINITSSFCSCKIQYYQNPTNFICQQCLYICETCGTGDKCITCNSALFRVLNTTTMLCECDYRYYDNGVNQTCFSCLYDCLKCSDYSSCTSCDLINDHRVYDNGTKRCKCTLRYFQDTSANPPICSSCSYSCLTCLSPTICLTCNNTANRFYNFSTHLCQCKNGYYDDGATQQCKICHYSCNTCLDQSSCIDCDIGTSRTLSTLCLCPVFNYFDDGSTKFCHRCHYSCSTCTNSTSCLTCNSANSSRTFDNINQYCKCVDGYYDDGYQNQLCVRCPYNCLTCKNASLCLTCDLINNHRYLPNRSCICMDGYYDDRTNNSICLTCHYTCKTCLVSNQCLSCNSFKFREYNASTHYCNCMKGYFDTNNMSEICQTCSYSCLTCETSALSCTSCDSNFHRTLNQTTNTCPCNTYYFDDLFSSLCKSCHYSCLTCSDNSTCDSCDLNKHRQSNPTNDLCKCMTFYYDDGFNNQVCNQCEGTCLECLNQTSCTSCDISKLRIKNLTIDYNGAINNFCKCIYKYYGQTDPQAICLPCHYSCAVCKNQSSFDCLFCTSDAHRTLNQTTSSCLCIDGYFDNGTIETCLSCHPWCSKCTAQNTNNCSGCVPPYYLKLDVTTCFQVCPSYFYGQNLTMTCQNCQAHCSYCFNSKKCYTCDNGFPLYRQRCLLNCPVQSTFLDSSNNICIDCPKGCLTCTSLIQCQSCTNNYYLQSNLHLCLPCFSNCKLCDGPGQTQCLGCQYPLLLKDHSCINISCPYGQYVHSTLGCSNCSDIFPSSITCTNNSPTLCQKLYTIRNNSCQLCTQIQGYVITSSQQCKQICGDGLLLQLQCDDGNIFDGDGCSSGCLTQEGWYCDYNTTEEKSICKISEAFNVSLQQVVKYGGQNKIKLVMLLSIPIRLNKIFFVLQFSNTSSVTWQFSQSQTNFRNISFNISYKQSIQNNILQIFYGNSQQRRLLQSSTSMNFNFNFTIASYPPAIFYSEEDISLIQTSKQLIYISSISALFICLIAFVFPHKAYIHIFISASIPAQIFIIFGLGAEKITDWIKWSLKDFQSLSFIGGFKLGKQNLKLIDYYGYSIQISENMGIICCIILGVWVLYLILNIIQKYCCKNQTIKKLAMNMRYFILTIQFCFFPHMMYSSVNALYNSSLTSDSSSINVCLAIFVIIYLLGLLIFIFILTIKLKPNELMINQELEKLSETHQQDRLQTNAVLFNIQKQHFMPPILQNFREEDEEITDKVQDSSRSQIIFFDERNRSKDLNVNASAIIKQINYNKQARQKVQPNGGQNNYHHLLGYWYNNQQVYHQIQARYTEEWLIYDYVQLYAVGKSQQNQQMLTTLQKPLKQSAQSSSSELIMHQYRNAKFYLPLSILKTLLICLFSSTLQSQPFWLYIIVGGLNLVYLIYILVVRPFSFTLSNIRIIFLQVWMICGIGLMVYYSYRQKYNSEYNLTIQKIVVLVIAILSVLNCLLLILEILGTWRMQIWNKLQPWLVSMRLRGARKVRNYEKIKRRGSKRSQRRGKQEKKQEKQQEIDAFYARMLKKQLIEKQYRRERMLKKSKIDRAQN